MQTIRNLMRADRPIVFKYKKSTKAFVIFLILLSIAVGIAVEPMTYSVLLIIFMIVFPAMTWQNYGKANMSTLHGILPVSRTEIVRARYLLLGLIFTVFSAFTIIAMALSFYIRKLLDMKTISLGEVFEINVSEFGFILIYHSFCMLIGYVTIGVGLRKGFRSNFQDYRMTFKKRSKEEKKKARRNNKEGMIALALIFGFYLLIAVSAGISQTFTIIGSITSVLASITSAVAQLADGWLLSLIFMLIGIGYLCYQCICSEIEFEQQEL